MDSILDEFDYELDRPERERKVNSNALRSYRKISKMFLSADTKSRWRKELNGYQANKVKQRRGK